MTIIDPYGTDEGHQRLVQLLGRLERYEQNSIVTAAAASGSAMTLLVAILLFPGVSATMVATVLSVSLGGLTSGWIGRHLSLRRAARKNPARRKRVAGQWALSRSLLRRGIDRRPVLGSVAFAELGARAVPVRDVKTTRLYALINLLVSLFSVDDMRTFFCLVPNGQQLLTLLPSPPVSQDTLAREGVIAMVRLGMVDEMFFTELRRERPNRSDDISRVEMAWCAPSTTARSASVHTAGAFDRVAEYPMGQLKPTIRSVSSPARLAK